MTNKSIGSLSLEDLALLVRLLKKSIEVDPTIHEYVKATYGYFNEVYADSSPDNKHVKEF